MTDNFEFEKQFIPTEDQQPEALAVDGENEDEHKRSLLSKVIGGTVVAAAVGSLIFEQSPGNETLRATEGFKALERTGSEYAAGTVVGGITMAIEMGSGALAAAGFSMENKRLNRFLSWFKKTKVSEEEEDVNQEESDTQHELPGKLKEGAIDTGTALGFGSAIVVARKRLKQPDRGFRRDMLTATKASSVIAGVSGFIGYLVAGGVRHAEKVGLGEPADLFVNYATDWKFWGGIFGGAWVASVVKDKIADFRNNKNQQVESKEELR